MISIDQRKAAVKILLCVVATIMAIAAWSFLFKAAPRNLAFAPHSGKSTSNMKPNISIKWQPFFLDRLDPVNVSLDGKDLTKLVHVQGNRLDLRPPFLLKDGKHFVTARLKYKFGLSKEVILKWAFDVDTKPPFVELGSDGLVGCREAETQISGLTEPIAQVKAKLNGKQLPKPTVYGGGTFFVDLNLISDDNKLELEAADSAGNRVKKTLRVVVDKEPPIISGFAPTEKKKIRTAAPVVETTAQDRKSGISSAVLKINGQKVQTQYHSVSSKISANPEELAEGKNSVEVEVKDAAGNVSTASWSFLIDSTEEFGKRPMTEGAVGADVKELQARLQAQGYVFGKMAGQYDAGTVQAVKAFQEANQVPVTGTVGPEDLRILKPDKLDTSKPIPDTRVVITISKRSLQLYSGENLVKIYPIAVGRGGRFKTPVGKHRIREKIINPTWYPPAWAGINHPIPPGPNNPLGNREMKLSVKGYSIHGTNKPTSIGSPATHGCIRMYPSDVLELFELVNVGTPVEIKS